jgi:hypothetical protein
LLPVCIGGQDVKLVGRELLAVWSDGGAGGRHGGMAAAPSAPSSSSFVGSARRQPRRGRIWARRVVWWKSGDGGATPAVRSSPSLSARSLQWQEEWGRWVSNMEEVPRLRSKKQRRDRCGGGDADRTRSVSVRQPLARWNNPSSTVQWSTDSLVVIQSRHVSICLSLYIPSPRTLVTTTLDYNSST